MYFLSVSMAHGNGSIKTDLLGTRRKLGLGWGGGKSYCSVGTWRAILAWPVDSHRRRRGLAVGRWGRGLGGEEGEEDERRDL